MENKEVWKKIPGTKCEVSSNGRVRGTKGIKNLWTGNRGYKRVSIYYNETKKVKIYDVHVLVSLIFHGETPEGYQVDHIDDDILNNHESNFQFLTGSENVRKAKIARFRDGKMKGYAKCSKKKSHYKDIYQAYMDGKYLISSANKEIVKAAFVKAFNKKYGTNFTVKDLKNEES